MHSDQLLAMYNIPSPDGIDAYIVELTERRCRRNARLAKLGQALTLGRLRSFQPVGTGRLRPTPCA